MTIDSFTPIPIFNENSVDTFGNLLVVEPGEIAIVRAFGFVDYAERNDNTTAKMPQSACLEMLLFKENALPKRQDCHMRVLNFNDYVGFLMAAEKVRVGGCAVSISKCHNLMLLNIPGVYRFIMNDITAVGNARIFYQIISDEEFPWDSDLFI